MSIEQLNRVLDIQDICEEMEIKLHVTIDCIHFINKKGRFISDSLKSIDEAYGFIRGYKEAIDMIKDIK